MTDVNQSERNTMNVYAQGDILLIATTNKPTRGLAESNRVLVAEGEATGHHHVLEATDGCTILSDTDVEFVRIMGANGLLTHQEHDTVTVPPGDYIVRRQREYAYGESIRVAD